ncbi:MFS transporter [Flammeovirga yaeyamensis]|uniref:MFS transporter n=1 Tax=Flammeovirga yaeyamensis TaxID=367791 RepID=A0AAX1N5S7_9BACT|nr:MULTISPECIES: MFS transporter [Flammeovirga]ANQ49915.1 MFS transporter [Flammeovirga sp. MY04]MBB3701295.1 ACS family hexuronate transporter-like MFS transporter [Flammeovirga yaeyamensis]NMF38235.1 MFS transporter [Flammeovirga yaeyamensis]QWG02646.1 MFS transporter [Flammeovirga yaeyamensis]
MATTIENKKPTEQGIKPFGKNLRWAIIGLIAIATIINYIDRSALSMMFPGEGGIGESLGLDKTDYAVILNVFMVFYALGQSFSGRIFDKVGTRFGYVISIGIWSISSFCHTFARGIFSLGFFRSTLGFGEAGNWPGAAKSNAEWFPIKERAFAQGLFNAGASLGSVVAPPFIAALFVAFGWQTTFMIIGSLGMLWIIPWLLINKGTPTKHPWMTEEECHYIKSGQSKADNDENAVALPLSKILSYKQAWSVLVSRFFLEPIWWLFVGWMPIYLADVYGFDVKEIGAFAWIPYVGAALGSVSGGYYSGLLIKQGHTTNRARKQTIIIGSTLMLSGLIAVLSIDLSHNPDWFVYIVAVVLFGFQFSIGNVQTLPSDFFSGKNVGTLAGFGGTVGVLSVVLMNFIVSQITNYNIVFGMIAAFVPLSVIAIFFLAKDIKPVEED